MTNYHKAWIEFERLRRDAMKEFDFLKPDEVPTEEIVFIKALTAILGPPRKTKKEPHED